MKNDAKGRIFAYCKADKCRKVKIGCIIIYTWLGQDGTPRVGIDLPTDLPILSGTLQTDIEATINELLEQATGPGDDGARCNTEDAHRPVPPDVGLAYKDTTETSCLCDVTA